MVQSIVNEAERNKATYDNNNNNMRTSYQFFDRRGVQ